MNKENKSFLKDSLIILIIGIIVNAFCFFIGTIYSKAANISSSLPYLCQSENSFYNQEEIDNILSLINERYPESDIYNKKFIISLGAEYQWYDYNNYIEVPTYRVYVLPDNNIYGTTWSSNSNFQNFVFDNSSFYIDLAIVPFTSYTCMPTTLQPNNMNISKSTSSGVSNFRLFGSYSPHTINNNFYQVVVPGWNYPVYTNYAIQTTDPTGETGLILSFSTGIIPGEFTDLPPLEDILNNISNSYTPHTNDTPPTYDSSISDGQNISNAINGHSQNMNNAINNLGNNIKNWFDNMQRKLTDTTNAILGGLHNGFATINQNFKDFFGAKIDFIIEKLEYLIEPLSLEELTDNLNNSSFSSDLLGSIDLLESFKSSFTSGTEPNTCTFTLDFTNSFYNFGVCTFSLDWLLPIRPIIRLFLGGLCVYSLIVSIFTSLNTFIGGTSSINDDI